MLKIGEYVVYKRDVCVVKDIMENYYKDKDYYYLLPVNDKKLKVMLPTDNMSGLRPLMSREDIKALIHRIPGIETLKVRQRYLENDYKALMDGDQPDDLVKIIKTAYVRNMARIKNKKKLTASDEHYFEVAEKCLYTEIGVVLSMNFEETKAFVKEKVEMLA